LLQSMDKKVNQMRVTPELHRALKLEAAKLGISMQDLRRQILADALLKNGSQKQEVIDD